MNYLTRLLHLVDPTLPIGGYTHSAGLETFVQQGIVTDKTSLQHYVEHQLNYVLPHNDGAFMSMAYDAVDSQDVAAFADIDNEFGALKSAKETRQAAEKLGNRLFKIFADEILLTMQNKQAEQASLDFMQTLQHKLYKRSIKAYYPCVFALVCVAFDIPKAVAMHAFYYNSVLSMITNGVKLIPLGQMQGQEILFALTQQIESSARQTLARKTNALIAFNGAASPAYDIRCMQHERLYSRLYMS